MSAAIHTSPNAVQVLEHFTRGCLQTGTTCHTDASRTCTDERTERGSLSRVCPVTRATRGLATHRTTIRRQALPALSPRRRRRAVVHRCRHSPAKHAKKRTSSGRLPEPHVIRPLVAITSGGPESLAVAGSRRCNSEVGASSRASANTVLSATETTLVILGDEMGAHLGTRLKKPTRGKDGRSRIAALSRYNSSRNHVSWEALAWYAFWGASKPPRSNQRAPSTSSERGHAAAPTGLPTGPVKVHRAREQDSAALQSCRLADGDEQRPIPEASSCR